MFTIEQIKSAHNKVKSGADFPAYIQELKKLGVTNYETHVSDGHTDYMGANGFQVSSSSMYDLLQIEKVSNADQFKSDLKAHQQGQTDYYTFCKDSAKSGVEKWIVNLDLLTCTYLNKSGSEILVEKIPE